MATNYDIDYNDERFTQVESDKEVAMNEVDATYDNMINGSDKFYQDQIDAAQDYAETQSKIQQDKTDFAIEKIEQQKEEKKKDYIKEQSGSYVDWQKQSNQYGVSAEQQAAAGLANSGYSESSVVSMYNTYQNRVATAREVFNRAILDYDNQINEARLQNNSILAEIAYKALEKRLELSLEGFQYKNTLIIEKADKKREVDKTYYERYQDVLDQINKENEFAENIRQYNQDYNLRVQEYNEKVRQFNLDYDQRIKEFNEEIRQFDEEIARLKKKDEREYKLQIEELELKKEQAKEQKRQFEEEQKLEKEKLAEEKRQFDKTYAKSTSSSGSSKSSGSGSSKSGGSGSIKKSSSGSSGSSGSVNKSSSGSGKNQNVQLPIDMKSVLALGYGPISASRLAELESQGIIESYKSGNQMKFRKSASTFKQESLLK